MYLHCQYKMAMIWGMDSYEQEPREVIVRRVLEAYRWPDAKPCRQDLRELAKRIDVALMED